jgi:polar amino acid transport system substrate-binding protein
MKRTLRALVAAVAVAAISVTAACGSSGSGSSSSSGEATAASGIKVPDIIKQSGVLKVAISPSFPPMEYLDKDNKLVGVDVDLANGIAKEMGVKAEFSDQQFAQLIQSVQTDRADMVMSGLSDTVERQKTMDFVDYFATRGRFYTLKANAGEFTDKYSVCGKSVAVSEATDYYGQVQTYSKDTCVAGGKPAIKIVGTDSGAAARLQLQQKRADVAVQGQENLVYFSKTQPGEFADVLAPLPAKPYAVGVKKGNTELATAVQQAIQKMIDDGSFDAITKKYNVSYGKMTPVVNGVK